MKKRMLTGNQAISRGFYEAGGLIASSYPGSPAVGIIENTKTYKEVYSEFSTNEKVALEVAIGGSFNGARSMVAMKHVGLNISLDPLMTFTETPTNGGFLLVSGDDPGLSSSQNEQDNRNLGKFANIGILDPSDSGEAKDFTKKGLEISEKYSTPMMLRITSRLCHSRSVVNIKDRVEKNQSGMDLNSENYCMIPANSRDKQYAMKERIKELGKFAYDTDLNKLEIKKGTDTLVITSGLMYNNLKELDLDISIWKLGLVYPISKKKAKEVTNKYKKVIVLEEMTPFIENELKLMGIECMGKEYFSFTKELDIKDIEEGFYKAGLIKNKHIEDVEKVDTVKRYPVFCTGCPHRPTFDIIKKSKAKLIIGDIGCYSLAALPPFEKSNSIISMGASIGITKGLRKAMDSNDNDDPVVAVIGDGTFFHSGIPSFINLLHQKKDNENITILILDNRTTAMTGGQHNASSGNYNKNDDMKVEIKTLLESIGFKRVSEIDQYNYDETKKLFKQELNHQGLSVLILKGPCALKYKMNKPHFYVDPKICISCRTCVKTGCPPLKMIKYEGIDKLKSSIDSDICVGCSVCAQVCPVNAIKQSKKDKEDDSIDN
ncbi:MAG: indolepyruvate ferredoxin oxidoreductase [Firmicutes bacterium]|nr:indolepyruvate ferredoxin oxidoreductase [Bacillota bacterium]